MAWYNNDDMMADEEKMIKFIIDAVLKNNEESERDNKLLFRKEIKYTVDFKSGKTVSRNEIKKLLMDYYKAKEDVIVVDRNIQETGKDSLKGYVKIYDTKEHAMLYEPDYELIRNGLKEKESK